MCMCTVLFVCVSQVKQLIASNDSFGFKVGLQVFSGQYTTSIYSFQESYFRNLIGGSSLHSNIRENLIKLWVSTLHINTELIDHTIKHALPFVLLRSSSSQSDVHTWPSPSFSIEAFFVKITTKNARLLNLFEHKYTCICRKSSNSTDYFNF